jgi:hypothetical protein
MSARDKREVERKIASGAIDVEVDGSKVSVRELRPLEGSERETICNAYPGCEIVFFVCIRRRDKHETKTMPVEAEETR